MDNKKYIKRLDDFEKINEGFLSSLFGGVKDFFTSEKGKIEGILKKIKEARNEEVSNAISVEKEIKSLNSDNSPEYRFSLTNLRRQARTYSALKAQEINALVKQARKISEEDPKLEAFFSAELAKIEVETKEKLIKNIGSSSDSDFMNQLNAEFDYLVKDANKKVSFYEEFKDRSSYIPSIEVPAKMSEDVLNFINTQPKESASLARSLDGSSLNKYYTQVRDFFFDLEDKYSTIMENIRKEKKIAEKTGNDNMLASLDRKEMNAKYHLRKNIDRIRSKVNTLEREMRNRRHAETNI
jgi:hypothetical protein